MDGLLFNSFVKPIIILFIAFGKSSFEFFASYD